MNTPRIAVILRIDGRCYDLVVQHNLDTDEEELAWYEGPRFLARATLWESALGLQLERLLGKVAKIECERGVLPRNCFECADRLCERYWGPLEVPERSTSMPSKKDVKAAVRKGVNPYAVAQAAVNKGKISPAKKEAMVKGVTKSVLAKGGKKACKSGKCKK